MQFCLYNGKLSELAYAKYHIQGYIDFYIGTKPQRKNKECPPTLKS
jgi:hypothetical protein